jgi:diacylglycerol kinase family enzyme
MMAPDAEPDDGLFDLCIAYEVSRARMFSLIPYFLRGTQATQEEITTGQAAHISVTAVEGTLPAQADGEILCIDGQHLEIELLSRQIEVICQSSGGAQ